MNTLDTQVAIAIMKMRLFERLLHSREQWSVRAKKINLPADIIVNATSITIRVYLPFGSEISGQELELIHEGEVVHILSVPQALIGESLVEWNFSLALVETHS